MLRRSKTSIAHHAGRRRVRRRRQIVAKLAVAPPKPGKILKTIIRGRLNSICRTTNELVERQGLDLFGWRGIQHPDTRHSARKYR